MKVTAIRVTVEVRSVQMSGSGLDIEVLDNETGETSMLEMENNLKHTARRYSCNPAFR